MFPSNLPSCLLSPDCLPLVNMRFEQQVGAVHYCLFTGYGYVKSLCGNRCSLKSLASGKKINVQTSRMGAHTEFSCWDSVKTNMNKTQQHLFWVYKCQIIQAAFPEVSHLFFSPILKELLHYFLAKKKGDKNNECCLMAEIVKVCVAFMYM